ncbi:hypothetical protein [Caulobacter sp. NIBR1757]|uniref:hypothetical protein n=1 Tax=Caulobacter sp. NIBR1757 TaxID=3016000 RepID=UPI0022F0B95E|nr:hypothetical protein [Caulobacter sp. NIBR1757]WGM39936.1 hypothetical protein AMEJIAPC_02876 [Caulobacter sp. NIBR1757]
MIKDRAQKRMAAKFCAAQAIVPFAEVVVRSSASLEESPVDITDIDVAGIQYGHRGAERRILFDCKTGKMSAINRALWVAGVARYVDAQEAYLILKKDAPYSHRLAANELCVHVHSELNFEKHASSVAPAYNYDCTYLDDMDVWDGMATVANGVQRLQELVQFSNMAPPLERNGPKGLRGALAILLRAAPEIDPRKPKHIFIYSLALSAFACFSAMTASDMKTIFQFDMTKEDFDRTARYYLWGGRDSYQMRRALKASIDHSGTPDSSIDLELPQWPRFLNMFRSFLDAPDLLSATPYLSKEIAFRAATGSRQEPDHRLSQMLSENKRARQFLFQMNAYLISAARLPKELQDTYESLVNSVTSDGFIAAEQSAPARTDVDRLI